MPVTLNSIIMEEAAQDLINKILYLIISQLTGIIFVLHLIKTQKKPMKLSFKNLDPKKNIKTNYSLKISPE